MLQAACKATSFDPSKPLSRFEGKKSEEQIKETTAVITLQKHTS